MKSLSKTLFAFAALCLLMLFVFPMWQITLIAPQYPEGITMYIWINQITGNTPSTLQNINILNHYIGMKFIEPDSIPELHYFRFIVIALVISGIGTALTGNKKLYFAWIFLLIILCVIGIYDFYLWEYDYGHNLSPTAPIKFPGMVYQPPLIGKKNLLNFVAKSYPYIGGWFVGLSILSAIVAFWLPNKSIKKYEKVSTSHVGSAVSRRLRVEA